MPAILALSRGEAFAIRLIMSTALVLFARAALMHCRIAPSARRLEPQHASVVFVGADIKIAVGRRPHVANTPV
jgi:hypothetical protein